MHGANHGTGRGSRVWRPSAPEQQGIRNLPSEDCYRFADTVAERGLATRGQIDECMSDLKLAEDIGAQITLDVVMVRKGFLTGAQAAEVMNDVKSRHRSIKRIAGYRFIKRVGTGGMGTVYKALQVSMDRLVALKILAPRLAENEDYVKRFMHEARAAAKLSHVNIVQGYDCGADEGYYYFAMEYVDGESVRRRLKREKRLDESTAVDIATQIAHALEHAWAAARMVHCDVKPDNILLTADGTAKLADLGLAKLAAADVITGRAGYTLGTPDYISPEQARGLKDIDVRADIYSLGATLYHILTGEKPFAGDTSREVLLKHVSTDIPDPRLLQPSISERVAEIMAKMCKRDRDERYQSPAELIRDLEGVGPVEPAPDGTRPSPKRRKKSASALPILAAGLLFLAVIGAIIYGTIHDPREPVELKPNPPDSGRHIANVAPAEKAFPDAVEYARANPTDFRSNIRNFAAVAKNHPGSEWGKKARSRVSALVARERNRRDALFRKIVAESQNLADAKEFGEALARLDELDKPSSRRRLELDRIRAEIEKKAAAQFAADKKAAGECVRNKACAQARAIYSAALKYGLPEITSEAQTELAKIDELDEAPQPDAELIRRLKAQKVYAAFIVSIQKLLAAREHDEAIRRCNALLKDPAAELFYDAVSADREDVLTVKGIWETALKALNTPGRAVAVRRKGILTRGTVVADGSDEVITIKANGRNVIIQAEHLRADAEILDIAGVGKTGTDMLKRVLFFIAGGENDKAATEMLRAKAKGVDTRQFEKRLSDRKKLLAAARLEAEAGLLWEKAQKALAAERFFGAHKLLNKLRLEHPGSQTYAAYRRQIEEAFGNATMVRIPAGPFIFAINVRRELPTFYMDRFEVTNAQYKAFLDDIIRTNDRSHRHRDEPPGKDHRPKYWTGGTFPDGKALHPVTGVDWYDAYAYAAWAGKRLPTEEEWEKAARGTEGRLFPWGSEWAPGRCNGGAISQDAHPKTSPVGGFAEWGSVFGVHDTAGNVWEYTATPGTIKGVSGYVLRGGSWRDENVKHLQATYRFINQPLTRGRNIGFRCCSDTLVLKRAALKKKAAAK